MSTTPDNVTAGNTEAEDLKPSQKFPDVPRLFSVSELAKVLELAPGTIANNVLADAAPVPDFIVGERMVWVSVEPWQTWVKERAEAKERRARERAEKEAASVKEFAAKISGNAKSELLKALLASMSPEEIAALGQ
jgi:alpha-L-arabinofuranosidase